MNSSRTIPLTCCVLGALLLVGGAAITSSAQAPQRQAPAPLVDADHLRMQPEDAAEGGAVFGSQSQAGMYIIRNRFAAGRTSRPHYHDQDRWVTVIKGTWWTGEGDVFDADKMIPIKEGGLMFHPAGFHHYDGAKDEDTIVQIMGMGPVRTVQTEVDANGQPVGNR
jgi:hypothetical protein